MILGAYAIIAIVVTLLMYYEDVGDLYLYDDSHWLVRIGVHALSAIFAAVVGMMWPLFAVLGIGAGVLSGIAWLINRYVGQEASDG